MARQNPTPTATRLPMVSGLSGGGRSNHELGTLSLSDHGQLCFAAFAWEVSSTSMRGRCPCLGNFSSTHRGRDADKGRSWPLPAGAPLGERANSRETTCFVTDTGTHRTCSTSYTFSGRLVILIRT